MTWTIYTSSLNRSGVYDGAGSSRNRSFWDGRRYDDQPTANRVAQHIVEAGYVDQAEVRPQATA